MTGEDVVLAFRELLGAGTEAGLPPGFGLIAFVIAICSAAALVVFGLRVLMRLRVQNGSMEAASTVGSRARVARAQQVQRERAELRRSTLTEELQRRDPAFDPGVLGERLRGAILQLRRSMATGELSGVRPFVSDGLYEELRLGVRDRRAFGRCAPPSEVEIDEMTVVDLRSGIHFDTLTVRVSATLRSAVDSERDESAESGDALVAMHEPVRTAGDDTIDECFTFKRCQGTHTRSDAGLLEGNCPSCSADVGTHSGTRCLSCREAMRSGAHDWVLVEIRSALGWRPSTVERVPGFAEARRHDPDLAHEPLEDRALVLFWRLATAQREGGCDALRSLAPEVRSDAWSADLAPNESGELSYIAECAIRDVRVVGLQRDKASERVAVEVSWSGTRMLAGEEGPRSGGQGAGQTLFVLERRSGIRTDPAHGFSGAHCAGCGAPDGLGASAHCPTCGALLPDPKRHWVLIDHHPTDSKAGRETLRRLRNADDGKPELDLALAGVEVTPGLVARAAQILAASGPFDEHERALLLRIAARGHILGSTVDELMQDATNDGDSPTELDVPAEGRVALQWITTLVDIALWGGRMEAPELEVVAPLASIAGIVEYDLKSLVEVRRQAFEQRTAKSRVAEKWHAMRAEATRGSDTPQ